MRSAWTRRRALAAGALQPIVTPLYDHQGLPCLGRTSAMLVQLQPANLVLAPFADVEKPVLVQRPAGELTTASTATRPSPCLIISLSTALTNLAMPHPPIAPESL